MTDVNIIAIEPYFAHWTDCVICNVDVKIRSFGPNYALPMYAGDPVPPEWVGPWGGATSCKECYDKYEAGQLYMWPLDSQINTEWNKY